MRQDLFTLFNRITCLLALVAASFSSLQTTRACGCTDHCDPACGDYYQPCAKDCEWDPCDNEDCPKSGDMWCYCLQQGQQQQSQSLAAPEYTSGGVIQNADPLSSWGG